MYTYMLYAAIVYNHMTFVQTKKRKIKIKSKFPMGSIVFMNGHDFACYKWIKK